MWTQDVPTIEETTEGGGEEDDVPLEEEMDLDDIMSEEIDIGAIKTKEDLLKNIDDQIKVTNY